MDTTTRKPRTRFAAEQLEELRRQFHRNRYITKQECVIAASLDLAEKTVSWWWSNERKRTALAAPVVIAPTTERYTDADPLEFFSGCVV